MRGLRRQDRERALNNVVLCPRGRFLDEGMSSDVFVSVRVP